MWKLTAKIVMQNRKKNEEKEQSLTIIFIFIVTLIF